MCRVSSDLEHLQKVRVEVAARLLEVHVEKTPVVRPAGGHHHVVDRRRQAPEESLQCSRIVGVERRSAQRLELPGGELEAFGIAAGEDQARPLGACSPGRFEPDAGAAADHDDSLPEEFRFVPDGNGGCCAIESLDLRRRLSGQLFAGLLRRSCRPRTTPAISRRVIRGSSPSANRIT